MATVPVANLQSQGMSDELVPSPTNLLMAAAQMHQMGRFDQLSEPDATSPKRTRPKTTKTR